MSNWPSDVHVPWVLALSPEVHVSTVPHGTSASPTVKVRMPSLAVHSDPPQKLSVTLNTARAEVHESDEGESVGGRGIEAEQGEVAWGEARLRRARDAERRNEAAPHGRGDVEHGDT